METGCYLPDTFLLQGHMRWVSPRTSEGLDLPAVPGDTSALSLVSSSLR